MSKKKLPTIKPVTAAQEIVGINGEISLEKALSLYEEKLEEETPSSPIRKAFTIERADGAWTLATLYYQDDQIVQINRTVPDLKAQAINSFKIAAFNYWNDYDKVAV